MDEFMRTANGMKFLNCINRIATALEKIASELEKQNGITDLELAPRKEEE